LAAAGLALLCGCVSSAPARTPSDGGTVPTTTAMTGTTGTSSAGGTGTVAGSPSAARPMARSVPVRLRIPAIGVDTAVMSLGLAADGTVQVPPIAAHSPAGWYDGSPTPGQTGPSVILGHVTVGSYGDGVFLHLPKLRAGDRVMAVRTDGSVATFAVDEVQTVGKADFPTDEVYGNVDHPALRLITCGGTRVTGGGGYTDNVIVYASLVADS
jgi:sortase (surface protein transpeptidase)